MFTTTRRWLRRNRTPLAIVAGLAGTAYLAGTYIVSKISETRQGMSDERIARENLRRRFSQNQEDCTYTTLALLPTATENVIDALPCEDILGELQRRKGSKSDVANSEGRESVAPSEVASMAGGEGRSRSLGGGSVGGSEEGYVHASQVVREDETLGEETRKEAGAGKTKMQLWNDLKITSITRALTLIYTLSLLTLLTRIQLNLLGRRSYLSSVISLASPSSTSTIHLENRDDDNDAQDYGNDFDTNIKYLTFSWWLLHRGWEMVMKEVETAVKECFGAVKPTADVSFERLGELILDARKKIEGSTEKDRTTRKWLGFLLPPVGEEESILRESGVEAEQSPSTSPVGERLVISAALRRLLDETSDLIDSPMFGKVLGMTLDSAFSLLVDEKVAAEAYKIDASKQGALLEEPRVQEVFSEEGPSSDMQKTAKLATVLAVFTRQAHAIGTGGNMAGTPESDFPPIPGLPQPPSKEPNEYLAVMVQVPDLKAFAAVVYSSNFEFETVHLESGEATVPKVSKSGSPETLEVTGVEEHPGDLDSAWRQALAKEDGKVA